MVSAQVRRLKHAVQSAEDFEAEFLVIDTSGKSDTAAIEAARIADFILLPVRPQIFDLETLSAMRDLLRVAGSAPAFVVLNGVHPQAHKQAFDEIFFYEVKNQVISMETPPDYTRFIAWDKEKAQGMQKRYPFLWLHQAWQGVVICSSSRLRLHE